MKTGIRIDAPRIDAEAGAAIAGAICEILQVAATTRTSETVTMAALRALETLSPKPPANFTITNCSVQGDTTEGDRIIP